MILERLLYSFVSSVVVATIMAILLNLILPKEETAAPAEVETKE